MVRRPGRRKIGAGPRRAHQRVHYDDGTVAMSMTRLHHSALRATHVVGLRVDVDAGHRKQQPHNIGVAVSAGEDERRVPNLRARQQNYGGTVGVHGDTPTTHRRAHTVAHRHRHTDTHTHRHAHAHAHTVSSDHPQPASCLAPVLPPGHTRRTWPLALTSTPGAASSISTASAWPWAAARLSAVHPDCAGRGRGDEVWGLMAAYLRRPLHLPCSQR